ASEEVSGTRLIHRTPAAERRATFAALERPLSATKMGASSSSASAAARSCAASASTAATRRTVSLALPSSAWQKTTTPNGSEPVAKPCGLQRAPSFFVVLLFWFCLNSNHERVAHPQA